MNARDVIRDAINFSDTIVKSYLSDLSEADLLVRPVAGANHIAWQLGHLISGENHMVNAAYPGTIPALPAGFDDKHKKETSGSDDPAAFLKKDAYLELYDKQRKATVAKLMTLTDAELDKPCPEQFQSFMKTIGDLFSIQASHPMMHVGQWAVTRRKLGRKPLF